MDAVRIELNLRKGGTTHPFFNLQFLTGGTYDPEIALFIAPSGREQRRVATSLQLPLFRGPTHPDLFDVVARHGLQFDQSRQTGVVFHMMTALSEFGIVGLTAVSDSAREADETYHRAERVSSKRQAKHWPSRFFLRMSAQTERSRRRSGARVREDDTPRWAWNWSEPFVIAFVTTARDGSAAYLRGATKPVEPGELSGAQVYDRHYARPFRDAEERNNVRVSLVDRLRKRSR